MATSDTYPSRSSSRQRAAGSHREPGDPGQPDQDHELPGPGAEEEEPGCGEHDHEQVEAADPRAQVVDEAALVGDEIGEEHEPRGDEDAAGDPPMRPAGQQQQRQDRGEDQRERHALLEARQRRRVRG